MKKEIEKMHPSEWYDAVFLYPGSEEDFWRGQARGVSDPIVVFPCGTGDLAFALAQDGHEVIALDQDHLMLVRTLAKLRAEKAGVREGVLVGQGDLTQYTGREKITGLICVPRNGWWCLPDANARQRSLAALARRLKPEGQLIIDGFNVITEERTGGRCWSKMHQRTEAFLTSPFNRWRKIKVSVQQVGDIHSEIFTTCERDERDEKPLGEIRLTCPTSKVMRREIEETNLFEIKDLFGNWRRGRFEPENPEGRQIWVLSKK